LSEEIMRALRISLVVFRAASNQETSLKSCYVRHKNACN